MANRAIKSGLEAVFEDHTKAAYWGMVRRVKAYHHVGLPFTLAAFRAWVLEAFSGNWDGVTQCCYCTALLNVQTFITDHRVALKFGGGIGLENLALCCEHCNCLKGSMSEDGFRLLIQFSVEYLHPQDANDMFSRMKNGSAYVRLRASLNARPQKEFGMVTNPVATLQGMR